MAHILPAVVGVLLLAQPVLAAGRHPDAPPETDQFAFLIGTWDCTVRSLQPDGTPGQPRKGIWVGRWELDGWAIRDDWTSELAGGGVFRGFNIRSFNPQTRSWDNRWLQSGTLQWKYFRAEKVGDTMVMTGGEGRDGSGDYVDRNTFFDISAESWSWRKDRSYDGGATWIEGVARIRAVRAAPASAAATVASQPAVGLRAEVDRYIEPYVATGNFSGSILIGRAGKILLEAAYGMADREQGVANTPESVFHLASVSRIFTCAAVLLLEQQGRLSVDDPVARYLPGYPHGDRITLHQLLTGSSGIPDINDLDDYEVWSQFPQTPSSLVEKFRDLPLEFEPGSRSAHSNSNYELLALIIETVSGESYGEYLREHLFAPLGMTRTAHDGDPSLLIPGRARGYAPVGRAALANAPRLDWSVKTGNGSIYSTVGDLWKWDQALDRGSLLRPSAVRRIFTDHIEHNGYGWFIGERFGSREVHINGRSPGYGSYWGRSLDRGVTVIVLGNIYNGAPTQIGRDLIAMVLGEPYERPAFTADKLAPEVIDAFVGRYRFGPDYYVPNRQVTVRAEDGDLFLDWGWLMPAGRDRFIDRLYGGKVEFRRDANGRVIEMVYDDFVGPREASANAPE